MSLNCACRAPAHYVGLLAVAAWLSLLGWLSLVIVLGAVTAGLLVWRGVDVVSFDAWVGRWLRSWWLRWILYAPKLPRWLHACGLSTRDDAVPVDVTVNLVGRHHLKRHRTSARVTVPKVKEVRSGASWDEVRVELIPGLKPEDVDESARAGSTKSAAGVRTVALPELIVPDLRAHLDEYVDEGAEALIFTGEIGGHAQAG